MTLSAAALATGLITVVALNASSQTPAPAPATDFVRDVRPILESRCYECHGPKKAKGRLRLDMKASAIKGGLTGPAVIPGNADDSLLVRRVLGLDGEDRMPKDKDPLPDAQVSLLRAWIAQGAAWPDDGPMAAGAAAPEEDLPEHWAYRRPVRPTPLAVSHKAWVRNPIDQFVAARLEKEGLEPSPEASKEALIRRVSLDLIGLPPTPAEIDAFARRHRPDAYERLVDRLLASPHYGERWARPWLDLARYADSNGYEKDDLRTMWKYRDWVIEALNDDHAVRSVHDRADRRRHAAQRDGRSADRHGFHRNTQLNQEGGIDVEEARWETLLDRVNTTGTVWLGSTIGCAQCHNHKYDPFSQREYYRLLAFFSNVEYTVHGQQGGDHWIAEPTLDLPSPEQEKKRSALADELKALNAKLKDPSPEIDDAQPAWEQSMAALAAQWTTLTPVATHATTATLTKKDDGSVLASGLQAGSDRYQVELSIPEGTFTGIRLEALPDPSLPKGGPGRDYYGNFVLTGFHVDLLNGRETTAVKFGKAASDDETGDVNDLIVPPPRSVRDVAPGWSIDATRDVERLPRQAVFVPAQPMTVAAGARVRATLDFEGGNVGQALGRFRLSATSMADPARTVAIRAKTRAALSIAGDKRSPDDRRIIRAEYRGQTEALAAVRARVAAIEKELKELGIVSALVMRESPSHDRPSTLFRERGAYLSPGERVFAATPAVLPPMSDAEMPNRLGLARWLVSPVQPAHRARHRESCLGAVLRPRYRRNQRGLRHAGRAAVAPGAARLAGH